MKTLLKILGIIILVILGFALYVCATTGFFRSIENTYSGSSVSVKVPGAEDFAISREDGFLIISSDDRAARRDGKPVISGLYYMDLTNGLNMPMILKAEKDVPLFPHGISLYQLDSNSYRLLVVNHVTTGKEAVSSMDPETYHSIEEYHLQGTQLTHTRTFDGPLVFSPNDVVIIDEERFYFTNDHGSKTKLGLIAEDYLGFKRSNVVYYDGSDYKMVDEGIAYANGINYDAGRKLLFVASPRDFLVKVYAVQDDGSLEFETDVPCDSGVDNIELDTEGKIWIGSHPKLLAFSSYAAGSSPYAPSEIITIEYNAPDDYEVSSVYVSDGKDMSASTTAIPFQGKIYLGNVMDDHFIILDQNAL